MNNETRKKEIQKNKAVDYHFVHDAGFSTTALAQKAIELNDEQVGNIVRHSYQYVAMFKVIQKFVLYPASGGLFMDGFNKPKASTTLADHNMRTIARPNNDTLYQGAVLDQRHDLVIIEFPVIDSKDVVLETSAMIIMLASH